MEHLCPANRVICNGNRGSKELCMMFLLPLAGDITFCPISSDPSLNGSRKQETSVGIGTCKEWGCGCS